MLGGKAVIHVMESLGYEQDLSIPFSALNFCMDKVDFDPYFLLQKLSVLPK